MIKGYIKVINVISNILRDLAAIVLALISFLVVGNIILRIFGMSIAGTYDLVIVLTPVSIALALAYCAMKDGHVAIEMLVERFPKKTQKVFEGITGTISFVILIIATWATFQHAQTLWQNQEVTTTIKIPFAPIIIIIALGLLLLSLVVLGKVLNLFVKEGEQ